MITEHNRTFGKPYDIEASIGYYIIKPTDSGQLAKMIEIADEKMYEEKRSKNAQR
jgi:GGDEF domain-containing protein